MRFKDVFKGDALLTLVTAIVICVVLSWVIGIPNWISFIIAYALGCNHRNTAAWIRKHVLDRIRGL